MLRTMLLIGYNICTFVVHEFAMKIKVTFFTELKS